MDAPCLPPNDGRESSDAHRATSSVYLEDSAASSNANGTSDAWDRPSNALHNGTTASSGALVHGVQPSLQHRTRSAGPSGAPCASVNLSRNHSLIAELSNLIERQDIEMDILVNLGRANSRNLPLPSDPSGPPSDALRNLPTASASYGHADHSAHAQAGQLRSPSSTQPPSPTLQPPSTTLHTAVTAADAVGAAVPPSITSQSTSSWDWEVVVRAHIRASFCLAL